MSGVKGMKRTKEHNKKISEAAKKRFANPMNHNRWKGDKVGVIGIHTWLRKQYGYPEVCEICHIKGKKRETTGVWNLEWALVKGLEYERKRENFKGLCKKCHRNYDKTEEWNKKISNKSKKRIRNENGTFQ